MADSEAPPLRPADARKRLYSVERQSDNEEMSESAKPKVADKRMDKQELQAFVDTTMKDRTAPFKRVIIGDISNYAQIRIEQVLSVRVERINIDNQDIFHAMRKASHNLEQDDLLFAVDVINTATDITMSPDKHLKNTILVFKKDIGGGELTVLAEAHPKHKYLLVFDAWRKKKARRSPTANMPRANVLNGSSHADTPLSTQTPEKSSPRIASSLFIVNCSFVPPLIAMIVIKSP
ncbi:MAG: hypothetical protein LBT01_04710 [Spirochaetaceae bacterium]|jgi:hypothetical protein|nr:hypothetical protein [Spirochaetaceae bacterium]